MKSDNSVLKASSNHPFDIIQGGMGIGVSNWRLAQSVAQQGQLGVVSGTGIDTILVRRLQVGDIDGVFRQALSQFPIPEMAEQIVADYFIEGGKPDDQPFKLLPMPDLDMDRLRQELLIVANFVEVFLAKQGHDGFIGINYLEKIQIPTLPSLFGAMLAGVDYVLMGGGIPLSIPGCLDGLSKMEPVELKLSVEENIDGIEFSHRFNPKEFYSGELNELKRPKFLAIVSSEIVAKTMIRRGSGEVDGFVVEGHTAGGHNAPPRKTGSEEPASFGVKDVANLDRIKAIGKPFWLAGGCASPQALEEAKSKGARGIQVGTAFALSNESGVLPEIKQEVIEKSLNGSLEVMTDFQASPTGYPFKLACINHALHAKSERRRDRICDLGYLRELYYKGNGKLGYRCPGEPEKQYLSKGGCNEKTVGKQCLCNGLAATIGLEQTRKGIKELPIITLGDDLSFITKLATDTMTGYAAKEVISYLKSNKPVGA